MKIFDKAAAYFAPTGRIIMGAYFVLAGISKIMDVSGNAHYIEAAGFPAGTMLVLLAIVLEIGLGAALLISFHPRPAALALAGFTIFITFPFHGPHLWVENPIEQVLFMKNIVIFGALLFMAAHAGKFDTDAERASHSGTPIPTL